MDFNQCFDIYIKRINMNLHDLAIEKKGNRKSILKIMITETQYGILKESIINKSKKTKIK